MSRIPSIIRFPLALALLLAAACSDGGPAAPARPVVASVRILPDNRALVVGDTIALTAQALAADGSEISGRTADWATTDPTVVDIISGVRVVARAPGVATIKARVDGKIGEAEMTVTLPPPAPVASVELSASALSVEIGERTVLTASARDAAGRELTDRAATWNSDDATIAEVDAAGGITGKRVGATRVTVEIEGKRAQAEVTVTIAAVARVAVTPGAAVISLGDTRQYVARVYDARDNELTDRAVVWSTDAPSVSPINPTGRVWGASPGYSTIRATSEGKTGAVWLTVANGEPDSLRADLLYYRISAAAWGEIMILGESGAPIRVNAGTVSRQPTARPDGARIAFAVSMTELGTGARVDDIFAVDRNGMNMKRLTSEPGTDDEPAWSPDGERIAYRHLDPVTGRSSIWVMDADGANKVNLSDGADPTLSLASPAWSPDGSHLAIAATPPAGTTSGIWTLRADGTEWRQVTASNTGFDAMPSWSPDGARIAFTRRYEPDGDRDLAIVTLATGATQRLPLPGQQWHPAWSPDGAHIAFWQPVGSTGGNGIYTVRADGTNVRMYTVDPSWGGGLEPVWIQR